MRKREIVVETPYNCDANSALDVPRGCNAFRTIFLGSDDITSLMVLLNDATCTDWQQSR